MTDWIYKLYVEERSEKPLFYIENGYKVFTAKYHIERGVCCGNGCRHCPFEPKHEAGNIQVQDIYIKEQNE
jgi:hypothetical protein